MRHHNGVTNEAGADTLPGRDKSRGRVPTLRGELWRRHTQLQGMDDGSDDYRDAVGQMLTLTSDLLDAEADEAEQIRLRQRRIRWLAYLALVLLVAGAALLAVGVVRSELAADRVAILLVVLAVAAATVFGYLRRRARRQPGRRAVGHLRDAERPAGAERSTER